MRSTLLLLALAAPITSLGSCTGSAVPRTFDNNVSTAPAAVMPPARSSVIPGERFSYRMSVLGFDAGALDVAAGQPGEVDGRKVVFMRARAVSRGVVALLKTVTDEVTVWLDVDSGLPLYHHTVSKIGGATEEVEIRYAPAQFDIHERIDAKETVLTQIMPGGRSGYDLTSALMAIRGWQARPGDRASLIVLRANRFWQTHVQFGGRDSVKTKIGRFPAVRVDGVSRRVSLSGGPHEHKQARHFSIWMTDDARRVPLLIAARTDLGDVRMELVEYEAPDGTLIAAE